MIDSLCVCPWCPGRIFDSPIRRLIHNPEMILSGDIERGQVVLDIGCRSGTFAIILAKMAGESGLVDASS